MDILDKKRINYLAEKFDIYDIEDTQFWDKFKQDNPDIKVTQLNYSHAELGYMQSVDDKVTKISIPNSIFLDVVESDPSHNKKYVQWILTNFKTMLKNRLIHEAYRLVKEDLHDANEYLTVFERVKTTKRFKEVSLKNVRIKNVKNPLDINQYDSLELLYDAVDPFIERDPSEIMKTIEHMVSMKEAVIPFRDRKFLVYIPKTLPSSVIFRNFAGWCTARPENTNFSGYRNGSKSPDGKPSDLYIVIPTAFIEGESDEIYQFHFETNQFHDKSNRSIYLKEFLDKDPNLKEYFCDILRYKISSYRNLADLAKSKYMSIVGELGLGDELFKLMDADIPVLNYMYKENKGSIMNSISGVNSNVRFSNVNDISRFTKLSQLILVNVGLKTLKCDFKEIPDLEMIAVPQNEITEIDESIGELKNLSFINLKDNPIRTLPRSITKLDSSNGGNLGTLVVSKKDLDDETLSMLLNEMPNTDVALW